MAYSQHSRSQASTPACVRTRSFAALVAALLALALAGGLGCGGKKADKAAPAPATSNKPAETTQFGLTPEQAKQVLVKVGSTTITLGEFAERLGNQSPYLRARYNSPERRREFLENMVRFELLAGEAEKRGLDKTEDVERVRKQVMVQQMMQDLFDKGGIKLSDITEAEIKSYYDAHPSEFDRPAQVRASHILWKDRAGAERALAQLKQAPGDMELFRKIAQSQNHDPASADSLGDLRFFSPVKDPSGEVDEPERPDAVRKAAFSLTTIGELYPQVVQSERGFHIVKLTGKREALKRSLEDARRMIQNKLWREKREEAIEKFVGNLRAKANVQENAEALAKVQIKDGMGRSESVPEGAQQGGSNKPGAASKAAPKSEKAPKK